MFYTNVKSFYGRIFFSGYSNGRRFRNIFGGPPAIKQDDAWVIPEKLKEWNGNNNPAKNKTVFSYIKKSQLNPIIEQQLTGGYNRGGIDCILTPTNKKSIKHDDILIQIEHRIKQTRKLKDILISNGVSLYDDIGDEYKIIAQSINAPRYEVDFNQIKIGFLDIEIESETDDWSAEKAQERINVITLKIKNGLAYTWCLGEFHTNDKNVIYKCYKNEKELLTDFLKDWGEIDLDVVSHWNGEAFDIPYIVNRIKKVLGVHAVEGLSPFGIVIERKKEGRFGSEYTSYSMLGITSLDYMELYINYNYGARDSYSLNNICQVELGEGKLDYEEYGSLKRLYQDNFQKFVEYNIRDVDILEKLDHKMQFLNLAMKIAYMTGCNFDDVFSQIKIWDSYIYLYFLKHGYVLEPRPENPERPSLMGGYVKLSQPGIYDWVVSFDVNSLYPTLIRQLNLSPETLLDEEDHRFETQSPYSLEEDEHKLGALFDCIYDTSYLKEKNVVLTSNGNLIRKDIQGFLPKMVGSLYEQRVTVKKEMKKKKTELQTLIKREDQGEKDLKQQIVDMEQKVTALDKEQIAVKILLNALYGQLSNVGCRWFDIRIPRSITSTGQTSIRYISRRLNELLREETGLKDYDFVKTNDTDSSYLELGPLFKSKNMKDVDELNNYITSIIEPHIDKCFREFFDYMNQYDFQLVMKREAIADKGLFIGKKKRYALSVLDMEGVRYAHPQVKVVGLNIIKVTTPEVIREKLSEALNIILYKDEYHISKFIEDFREDFNKLKADEIGVTQKVSEIYKYLDSNGNLQRPKSKTNENREVGIPIHSKGAIYFNKLVTEKRLNIPKIERGQKVKYVYLKANPYGMEVISFPQYLPTELGLDQYIDYQTMFDKVFKRNIEALTEGMDWDLSFSYNASEAIFAESI